MPAHTSSVRRLIGELRRRRVFRTAALYVVGTWLVLQVADVVFPALNLPESAVRYVLIVAVLGFPAALIFGWFFDVGAHGIRRTAPATVDESGATIELSGSDYVILVALVAVVAAFVYSAVGNVVEGPVTVRDTAPDGPPMVAVLPFNAEGLDGDSEFFAVGVHDDLLTQLAQLHSMRVISRTSVLEYKGVEKNIREIGEELGADAILEGGVQMAGNRIRINAQLIDARTDEHLWAETYDRVLTPAEIFDVQTEIAHEISTALKTTLTEEDEIQLALIPTENMAAYRAYHEAMEVLRTQGSYMKDDLRIALEKAVELDPKFTRAWAELAGHLAFQNFWEITRPEYIPRVEEILETIREIAPNSADYLVAQAYYAYYTLKDYDLADEFISAAHEMRPSDMQVLMVKTWIERRQFDIESRAETARLARTLDPRDERWTQMLIFNLMLLHRYDEAKHELESTDLKGYLLDGYRGLLQLREDGDTERWLADIERLHTVYADEADPLYLMDAYIVNGDYAAAEHFLPLLQEDYGRTKGSSPHLSERNMAEIVLYWLSGKNDLMQQSVARAEEHLDWSRSPDGSFEHGDLIGDVALLEAVAGNTELAEQYAHRGLREMEEDAAIFVGFRHWGCRIFAIAGATQSAIECLRDIFTRPSAAMRFVEPLMPHYDEMRDDPAFVVLLAEFE